MPVMASNDINAHDLEAIQESIYIKEEVDTTYKSCSSTETKTEESGDSFVKTVSSIKINKQLQKALTDANESENNEDCSTNDGEIKEENISENVLSRPEKDTKKHVFDLEDATGSLKTDRNNVYENTDKENSSEPNYDLVPSIFSDLFNLFSSNEENAVQASSFIKQEVESISHAKEESKQKIVPFASFPNNYENFEEIGLPFSVENISKHSSIIPEEDELKAPTAVVPLESRNEIMENKSNETRTVIECRMELDANSQQLQTEMIMEGKLNRKTSENDSCRKLYNMKGSQVKRINEKKSGGKLKTVNAAANASSILKKQTVATPNKHRLRESKLLSWLDLKKNTISHKGEEPQRCEIFGYKPHENCNLKKNRTHIIEMPFQCEICASKFAASSSLNLHMRTHTGNKHFKCELCGHKFTVRSDLRQHMKIHTGENTFKCEMCGFTCIKKFSMVMHLKIHMKDKPFRCQICGYACIRKHDLQKHLRTHTGEKPFRCKICGYKCTEISHLKRHIRIHTGEKPFRCEMCGYECTQSSHLKTHMRTHTGDKPLGAKHYQCERCASTFTSNRSLTEHLRTHTGERPFQCELCGYKFTLINSLKRHIRTHTGEKPFICEVCGYKCICKPELERHLRRHTGERPFQCEICLLKYKARNSLTVHLRIHTGDKYYKCELCSYKSTSSSSLKVHMRTHTGDKPFKCELCGYKFTTRGSLKVHIRTHTGDKPFECDLCGYKCTTSSSLKVHIRTHTGDKPFRCELCGYKCTASSPLIAHMKTHSGK